MMCSAFVKPLIVLRFLRIRNLRWQRMRRVTIFDTTLRDGDQAAGFAFTAKEKLALACALADAGADIIETGFPLSSSLDYDVCFRAAREISVPTALMCRGRAEDIRETAKIFSGGINGILHISLPVSGTHIKAKLGKSEQELLAMAGEAVRFAAGLVPLVELGAEDATGADPHFLLEYCRVALDSGAGIVNIADTLGRYTPEQIAGLIRYLIKGEPRFAAGKAALSVHCHNDLGLALANTLSALEAGCSQVEVSVSGIGERAGNAVLEEVFANLAAHPDQYNAETGIRSEKLPPLIALAAGTAGTLSPLKPLSGWNIRAHGSGIHQQGMSKESGTYALPVLEKLNLIPERIVLSRHSGRAGADLFARRCCSIELDEKNLADLSARIKAGDSPLTGLSEFLNILADMGALPPDFPYPFGCVSFKEIEETRGEQRFCRVEAALKRRGSADSEPPLLLAGEGASFSEAILNAVDEMFHAELFVMRNAVTGYGNKIRLYAEIESKGRVYAMERIGSSRAYLLFQCFLDVINSGSIFRR
jgi:2-isopropylmalate synthase